MLALKFQFHRYLYFCNDIKTHLVGGRGDIFLQAASFGSQSFMILCTEPNLLSLIHADKREDLTDL